MSDPIYYTTIRFRQNKKRFSLDGVLHKGKKAMVKLSTSTLTVMDASNEQILSSIELSSIKSVHEKQGNVHILTQENECIFDFCTPFYSGLVPTISSHDRAKEFTDMLQKVGVKF